MSHLYFSVFFIISSSFVHPLHIGTPQRVNFFATHSATYILHGKYLLLLGPDNTYTLTAPKSYLQP